MAACIGIEEGFTIACFFFAFEQPVGRNIERNFSATSGNYRCLSGFTSDICFYTRAGNDIGRRNEIIQFVFYFYRCSRGKAFILKFHFKGEVTIVIRTKVGR